MAAGFFLESEFGVRLVKATPLLKAAEEGGHQHLRQQRLLLLLNRGCLLSRRRSTAT